MTFVRLKDHKDLLSALMLSAMLISLDMPDWISVVVVVLLLARLIIEVGSLPFSRWITNAAALGSLFPLYQEFESFVSLEASAGFLLILTMLKMVEARTWRDFQTLQVFVLCLIQVKFLFAIDLVTAAGGTLALLLVLYSMIRPHDHSLPKIQWVLRQFLYCLLPAGVLFFLFPRFSNPYAHGRGAFVSGFSGDLNPGGISRLAMSNEVAFRVKGLSSDIDQTKLYFRGSVLHESRGLHWRRGVEARDSVTGGSALGDVVDHAVDYEILLPSSNERWVFVLDPTEFVQSVHGIRSFGSHHEFRAPLASAVVVRGRWLKDGIVKADGTSDAVDSLAPFLYVTPQGERVAELAAKFLQESGSSKERIEAIRNWLSRHFVYTLTPKPSRNLEEFLFVNREGFCEHFSGAVATLLRMMGIPTRVVIGYQGGEFNRLGGFLVVRQKNAHSWLEYLNEAKEWVRLDPVQDLAPARLTGETSAESVFSFMEDAYQLANYRWSSFLVDFDLRRQLEILEDVGLALPRFFLVILIVALGFALIRNYRSQTPEKKALLPFVQFLAWARRRGFPKPDNWGFCEFIESLQVAEGSKETIGLPHVVSGDLQILQRCYEDVRLKENVENAAAIVRARQAFRAIKVRSRGFRKT